MEVLSMPDVTLGHFQYAWHQLSAGLVTSDMKCERGQRGCMTLGSPRVNHHRHDLSGYGL